MWCTHSFPLIPGLLLAVIVVAVKGPSLSQIDLFTNYSYSKGPCANKNSQETITQKCKYECTMNTIP